MSIHQGTIALEAAAEQLRAFLEKFDAILNLFGYRADVHAEPEHHVQALNAMPERCAKRLLAGRTQSSSVFDIYNDATRFCTHDLRSANRAMHLLTAVNRGFQSIPEWMPEQPLVDADATVEAEAAMALN